MQGKIKSLVICAFGLTVIAGCASSPSSQAVASNQGNVRSGKVTAVEKVAVVDQAVVPTSSGSSAVVTAASSAPTAISVLFNDGSEGTYVIRQSVADFTLGQPVSVVQTGDGLLIKSQ
jgi:hypothetical protein